MRRSRYLYGMVALSTPLVLAASTIFHLELTASHPQADVSIDQPPSEIWLEFSTAPDLEQTSFSVRGPDGRVSLGEIRPGETAEVVKAEVTGTMPAGEYMVSWVGAPPDDHAVRGRFGFSVNGGR